MNNWQEWVVWILLALCVVRIIQGGIRFFRRTRRGESPCAGCSHCESSHQCSSALRETKTEACSCGDAPNVSPCRKGKNKKNDKNKKKNCCG